MTPATYVFVLWASAAAVLVGVVLLWLPRALPTVFMLATRWQRRIDVVHAPASGGTWRVSTVRGDLEWDPETLTGTLRAGSLSKHDAVMRPDLAIRLVGRRSDPDAARGAPYREPERDVLIVRARIMPLAAGVIPLVLGIGAFLTVMSLAPGGRLPSADGLACSLSWLGVPLALLAFAVTTTMRRAPDALDWAGDVLAEAYERGRIPGDSGMS